MVTVVGDHGESLGEHGEQTHGILAYDATVHVPWILASPGGPRGVRVARDVSQVDLVPTLLDLLDLELDDELSGASLVPMLEGRAAGPVRPIYAEAHLPYYTYGWSRLASLRLGTWKYIDAPTPELYDLARDPRELSNLVEANEGTAHDLDRDLREMLAAGGGVGEATLELDSEAAERLRALGYLAVGTGTRDPSGPRPDPKDVIDLHTGLERARQLERDRLFEAAERQIRAVLERDPGNLAALTDLASVVEKQGKLEEAAQVLERALELDPDYTRLYVALAGVESRRANLERALALIRTAVELDSHSIEAGLQEAYLLRQARQLPAAQEKVGELVAEHPDHPLVLLAWARLVQLPERDLRGAEASLRQALARDPFLAPAWHALGQVLVADGRVPDARDAFREGLKRQPDDPDLHAALGLLLAGSADPDAAIHLQEAIRLSGELKPDLHVALGAWLAEHGRLEEAEREYARVLELEPRHPGARNNRAVALYLSGRTQEAREDLERLIEEYPGQADAHNNLAAIAVDAGSWQEAEAHARRALELGSSSAQTLNNLGIALQEQGRLQEAVEAFEKALTADALYWQARLNLGLARRDQGEHRLAAEELEAVLEQNPGQAQCHYELGRLYAGPLADAEKARVHLNAFLRAEPRNPLGAEVRETLASLPSPSGRS